MDLNTILIILIPGILVSGVASWLVHVRLSQFSRIPSTRGYTGRMAAQRLLDVAGVKDVRVIRVEGELTNHYDPATRMLSLSPEVYDRTTVAAIGVATHEASHAIQHARGYYSLKWRNAVVPFAHVGSKSGIFGMLAGLLILAAGHAIGQLIFAFSAIGFSVFVLLLLASLPIELNASSHARQLIFESGIVGEKESDGVNKVLSAAALTYIAAFITSTTTLMHVLTQSGVLANRGRS